jgi:hypothetical protein
MLQIFLKIILTLFIISIQLYGLITIKSIWTQDLDIKKTFPNPFAFIEFKTPSPIIYGTNISYISSKSIKISTGHGFCGNKKWVMKNDIVYDLNSLTADMNYHYIYIDANSAFPKSKIFDSIEKPIKDKNKEGWYYKNHRCIGVVLSLLNKKEIMEFNSNNNKYELFQPIEVDIYMAPTGKWQAPKRETSNLLPVNSTEARIEIAGSDPGGIVHLSVTSMENAQEGNPGMHDFSKDILGRTHWFPLEKSRNLRIKGAADNDNSLSIFITGYQIER